MNKLEEQRIIEGFQQAYLAFPAGQLAATAPPLPDYVLSTVAHTQIGIELTEVFQSEALKRWSSVKDQVTNKLVDLLQQRLTYRFTTNVFPDRSRIIQKRTMKKMIEDLANIFVKEFGTLPNDEWGEVRHVEVDLNTIPADQAVLLIARGYRNLPSGIERIRIHRYDGLPYSYNSKSEGGLVPNLTFDYIQPILEKKEKLLARQPALDKNWLVIREGNYFTGTFDHIDIPLPITSTFEKVFLYRTGSNEVIELK